jgi:hypothetical protein
MKHFLVALVVLAAGLSGVAGVVSAQDNPVGTETATSETGANETYAVAVDPVTRVVEWEYDEGRFKILVEADVPQMLTVSESPDVSEGVGSFNVKRISLPRGKTEIEISAGKDAGAAVVTMTTSQCVAAGSCPYLSTGERSGPSPFERTSSSAGWMGGVAITALMVGLAAYRTKTKVSDGPEEIR